MLRSERIGHTLQPTALVHEAYLRLIGQRNAFKNRTHFFATAAAAMRRILVDHARRKMAERRGGAGAADADYVRLERSRLSVADPDDVLFTHDLIEELRATDETQARIIELRFFGELSVEEVAESLGWTKRAVEAEWTMIRAIIRSRLERTPRG